MARVELTPAYVIHRRVYRETSLLLDVFSRDFGRLALVAKGARRPKSRWRALLQPHRPLLVSFAGRGELQTLVNAEAAGPTWALAGKRLFCALYINELLLRLVQREAPLAEVFEVYQWSLGALAALAQAGDSACDLEPVLRGFEAGLLSALGYGLLLDGGAAGLVAGQSYAYLPDHGVLLSPQPQPTSVEPVWIEGGCLQAFAEGFALAPQRCDCLASAKRLMRACLAPHLGPKPLKSRALFS